MVLMAYYGADPGQLRALAAQFNKGAAALESHAMTLHSMIGSATSWQGPDAERFRSQWTGRDFKAMSAAITMLRSSAQDLKRNADEQEDVSGGSVGAQSSSAAPSSTAGLMSHVHNSRHDADGMRIEKVIGPDGETRLIVYLKGTGASDRNFFQDLYHDGELIAGIDDDEIRSKIDAALDETPHGRSTDVMLVGFSQGGLAAQQIAASGDYNVTNVVTYGSPVITPDQQGIDAVHMHASGDNVPLAGALISGGYSPFEQSPTDGNHIYESDPHLPHGEDAYEKVAADFDNSNDPRFRDAKDSMKNYQGVVVDTYE
ncbi:hypothetical protein DVS77_18465 [Mycolicibacterium moriokaense]|nr:hypothetical protein DVS77_18465 [Mycolicibacterium moriokaense]